jgi:hypothetical protein
MQPKIWLACVLSCMGFIIVVFYLQPRAESDAPAQAQRVLPAPAAKPETNPTTQIVAPPAEMSSNPTDPSGLELNASAGFVPPLGESSPAEQQSAAGPSGIDPIRMAADPRATSTSRYDAQGAAEPSGVRIDDVGPLDVSEDFSPEGGRLR